MTIELGYTLSSEDFGPGELVELATRAEETGFRFALVSDHFHPWVDAQGESPFVWSVLGGISQATKDLQVGTGVTCPLIRIHPAIVAQAAATVEAMMPGRFFLGVGTGENLNEHVVGARWPAPDERLDMLEEAIEVIRLLWRGGMQTHRGPHYTVDHACIYSLPEEPPPIYVAAAAPLAAKLAGRCGDGLVSVAPDEGVVERFRESGGEGKPRIGQLHVCYDRDEAAARERVRAEWPNLALGGSLGQELPLPSDFEAATETVRVDDLASVPCGPDPDPYLEQISAYEQAGYTHVYLHQVGDDQEAFFEFYASELRDRTNSGRSPEPAAAGSGGEPG